MVTLPIKFDVDELIIYEHEFVYLERNNGNKEIS